MDDTILFIFWSIICLFISISNKFKKDKFVFIWIFIFIFFITNFVFIYSIIQTDKRTDYPGKEIAAKVQITWDQNFDKEIEFVTGNEWNAGNLILSFKIKT